MKKKATLLIAVLLLGFAASSWADDDAQVFPNRLQTSPPPDDTPKTRVTSVPAVRPNGDSGAMSPDTGSAMGLGVSIPLGRKQKNKPQPVEKEDSEQE